MNNQNSKCKDCYHDKFYHTGRGTGCLLPLCRCKKFFPHPTTSKSEEKQAGDVNKLIPPRLENWEEELRKELWGQKYLRNLTAEQVTLLGDFTFKFISTLLQEERGKAIKELDSIKNDFITRCAHEDTKIDDTLKEETIYHIDHAISKLRKSQ